MKTLWLLRHAKSSWDTPGADDFNRPLNKRGQKTAPLIGKYIKQLKIKPNLVLCSPAQRTSQTIKLVLEATKADWEVTYDHHIYAAGLTELLYVLTNTSNKVSTLLLVGHNPGIADLLAWLTATIHAFPTCTLAQISLDSNSWHNLQRGSGKLDWVITPNDLCQD